MDQPEVPGPSASAHPGEDNEPIPEPSVVPDLACEWTDCTARLGTAQKLVQHIYTAHVQPQTHTGRWACAWRDCSQAKKAWNRAIGSARMLLAHVREEAGRATDWSCALCDACREFRVGDVARHVELFHGVLVPAHDRGAKAAKRKNGTHVPPPSGAKPRPPRFNTETGQHFTGYKEPVDWEAVRPTEYPISPTLRDRIVDELRVHPRALPAPPTPQAHPMDVDDGMIPDAGTPDIQAAAGSISVNAAEGSASGQLVRDLPIASTSGTHASRTIGRNSVGMSTIEGPGDNVTGAITLTGAVGHIDIHPGPTAVEAGSPPSPTVNHNHASSTSTLALVAAAVEMDPHGRSSPRSPAPAPAPAPQPAARHKSKDYRAAYLIEKAKYRYASAQREALLRELAQLRAELDAAYGEKEGALDAVLRAQFGSTADSVLSNPGP